MPGIFTSITTSRGVTSATAARTGEMSTGGDRTEAARPPQARTLLVRRSVLGCSQGLDPGRDASRQVSTPLACLHVRSPRSERTPS
jgi:hypothetical protein